MAEQDFYPSQGNRFRGSRYANFTGGGINAQGNIGGVAPTANPGLLETSSGNQSSGVSTNLTQMQSSNRSKPQIEVPSVGESLKNAAIGSALPYAGSTIGSTAGAAMAGGATFGEGISQGLTALGDKVSGFLGGGAAEAAGSAVAGNAAGSFSSRLTSSSTLGGAAGVGLGTAAATLLTGGDVETAAKSGVGSAAGYAVGTTVGGPIGGMIGGAIGGVVGGGSVICTELHRQGLISTEQLSFDTEFASLNLSMVVMRGYWFWAKPYVRLMQKNTLAGRLATIVGLAVFKRRYKAICFVTGVSTKFSMSGYLIRLIGEAMCYAIGCCIVDTPESRLKWKGI